MMKDTPERICAARELRMVREYMRHKHLTPWDTCIVAAQGFYMGHVVREEIKGVAIKFKPTPNCVISH